ncbi:MULTISPECIES: hypothetical protein [unclassified Burkholderia]|uniref:hypothetical protein n=1 Tax=unclassified Burkholderia TaxID=2613784 RepID=UPI001E321059|nr:MULTISPECIES: hypothetical protein [unclassified Burkholderia]
MSHAQRVRYTRRSPTRWSGIGRARDTETNSMIGAWRFWGIGAATAWAAVSGVAFAAARIDLAAWSTASAACFAAPPGLCETNAIALPPSETGGRAAGSVALGDAADSTHAASNAHKLAGENQADVRIGSTVSVSLCSFALAGIAARLPVRAISSAVAALGAGPFDAKRAWGVEAGQNDIPLSSAIARHGFAMRDMKTVAFVGFNEARNLNSLTEFRSALPRKTLDTPRVRGDAGEVQPRAQGITINGFLRVCGEGCNGTRRLPGPILIDDQFLHDSNFSKPFEPAFKRAREGAYDAGKMPTLGEHARGAAPLLARAVPVASTRGASGVPAARNVSRTSFGGRVGLDEPLA